MIPSKIEILNRLIIIKEYVIDLTKQNSMRRTKKRSHSDVPTEWLDETNKGRMPYQIPHNTFGMTFKFGMTLTENWGLIKRCFICQPLFFFTKKTIRS
jgi:hypothetical protein